MTSSTSNGREKRGNILRKEIILALKYFKSQDTSQIATQLISVQKKKNSVLGILLQNLTCRLKAKCMNSPPSQDSRRWCRQPQVGDKGDEMKFTRSLHQLLSNVYSLLLSAKNDFICSCCRSFTKWCPTLCHPMDCSLPGSSVHGIPRQYTGVGSQFLLQGICLIQGLNPRLWHQQADSLPLSHQGGRELF